MGVHFAIFGTHSVIATWMVRYKLPLVCGLNCGLLPAVVRVPAGRSPQSRLVKEQELFTYMTLFLAD